MYPTAGDGQGAGERRYRLSMNWIRYILLLAIVVGGAVRVQAASEEERKQELLEMMKARDNAIQKVVRSETGGETEAGRERLKAIIGDLFDYETFSELTLKRYWKDRTEAERVEFIDLVKRLTEKNYADPKLHTKSERIEYIGVELDGAEAVVKTMVYYKSEHSSIDYKLHQVDGKWLVYDMVIDDLSVARNNRSQFYKEIRKSSYEGLVQKLKDKLLEERNDEKG